MISFAQALNFSTRQANWRFQYDVLEKLCRWHADGLFSTTVQKMWWSSCLEVRWRWTTLRRMNSMSQFSSRRKMGWGWLCLHPHSTSVMWKTMLVSVLWGLMKTMVLFFDEQYGSIYVCPIYLCCSNWFLTSLFQRTWCSGGCCRCTQTDTKPDEVKRICWLLLQHKQKESIKCDQPRVFWHKVSSQIGLWRWSKQNQFWYRKYTNSLLYFFQRSLLICILAN